MAIARYNLSIRYKGKVLIALPTTTINDGHNNWTLPNDLIADSDPKDAVAYIFNQITGLDLEAEAKNRLEYKQRVEDGKIYYRTEIVLDHDLPVTQWNTMASCRLTRYDKASNLRIPKYVKFKWVPEDELYYWLTRQYCRIEDVKISYFYPDNGRF